MTNVIPFPSGKTDPTAMLAKRVDRMLRRWNMVTQKTSDGLLEFEEELSATFREAQLGVLKLALEAADEPGDAVVYEGRVCRYVLTSSQTYVTSAGEVSVRRNLFRDRSAPSEDSFSVLDKRLGMIEGYWTPKAAREALWMVTQMVPKKAAEALKRLSGMTPSKASLDRLPKAMSKHWEEQRAELEQVLFDTQQVPQGTDILAVSLDGVYAPIESEQDGDGHVEKRAKKHAKGLAARGPDAYREVGCASIAFYSANAEEVLGVVRFGRAPESKKKGVKEMLRLQLAAILKRSPKLTVVFLSDGAPDHWEFFDGFQLKGSRQALDFFHAAEHLNAAYGAAFGEGSVKAQRAFAEKRHILRHERDGADTVRRSLARLSARKGLSANSKRILARAVRYFTEHAHRMNYAELSELGVPIGSGVMEATCKTLVAQRFKLSGQRWVLGVQAILTPRGWDQTERFDEAFSLLAATYQEPIEVYRPLEGRSRASG